MTFYAPTSLPGSRRTARPSMRVCSIRTRHGRWKAVALMSAVNCLPGRSTLHPLRRAEARPMALERRAAPAALTADDTGTLTGYAARWGLRDSFGDVLTRGAFAASLDAHRAAGTKPLMLWHHDP